MPAERVAHLLWTDVSVFSQVLADGTATWLGANTPA